MLFLQEEDKYSGRKSLITKTLIKKVQDLKENKQLSVSEISRLLGISRLTIYKVLKDELNYVPYNRLVKNENQEEQNDKKEE